MPAPAAAAGTPNISLDKSQPAQALIGTQQEVHLTASNPLGEARGYNLSCRDVLPAGVAYAGSATPVEPRVLTNAPGPGETTLIFENVADLSANSKYDLSFKVEALPAIFQITKLHVYTDHAEAFVNADPRFQPGFNAKGEAIVGSYTGSASDNATTELTAVEVVKSEPSPEGEILRGVHEHQTVYTLTVKNNHVGPTGELEVEDLLPAGLEFLGCGTVDNTTDTATNPGSTEEYAGSGPIDPGHAPAAPECAKHQPYYVGTVLNPAGHPAGIYTQVKWKNLPELGPSQEFQIQYVAAIPILQNSTTWFDGNEPTAESLAQVANLDNNTGPETVDEEALTNYGEVHGKYEGVAVKDTDEMTRSAEDLAIQKSVTPTEIEEGGESTWTLNLEASEYRFVNGVQIEDTLPNGLCPVGKKGYEKPDGTAVEKTAECEAAGGVEPTYEIVGVPGGPQAAEYTSIKYLPNGTFKIHWDESSFGALAQLAPSEHLILTFPTKTRTFYQENYAASTPILTGDSWKNEVETEGPDFARCAPSDPLCTKGEPKIFTEEAEGTPDSDVSEASQEAGGVKINKTVRENEGLVPENCSGKYVEGTSAPFPLYRPGDEICWTLRVQFAAKLFAGAPVVTDFIPTDEEFVPGSAIAAEAPQAPEGENTLKASFDEAAALKGEPLKWTLGAAVESGTQIFEWRFKTKVKKEPQTRPEEITGNLMKFVYSNTIGETFPLRDRAEVQRQEPELSLEKQITEVGGKTIPKPPKGGKSTATANGGEIVKYELDLENAGNLDAEEAEVWDILPTGIECSDVIEPAQTPPQTIGCSEGIIKWTGVSIPEGALTTLTYEVKVPTDVAPGHVFVNHTGVRRYKSQTNTTLEKFEYIPAKNIDKKITEAESNTGPLLDEAELFTTGATLEKGATTETTQPPGNGAKEATIGELVDYTVTAKIPANSKVYGTPVIKDVLPATLQLEGPATATLDGVALPTEGLSLKTLANGAEVQFAGAFPTTPSATEHKVVLSFKARVLNVAANERGKKITNTASFEFEDLEEAGPTVVTKSVETPVVEPNVEVRKKNLLPAGQTTVAPGEVVKYETEVENKTGASTANEVNVVDTVPPGMKVVGTPTPAATVVGNTITWHIDMIDPGATEPLLYELEIEKPAKAASSFTNRVKATTQSLPAGQGGEPSQIRTAEFGQPGYESKDEDTVKLIGATVSKEVTPTEGTIGTPLTYTLHMNLPGEIEYFDTTMVDQLPKGLTFGEVIGTPECQEAGGVSCGVGTELTAEAGPAGSTLRGWYFGNFSAGKPRELTVEFKAHANPEATEGELKNALAGSYNETPKGEPTTLPVPGSESPAFNEETEVAEAGVKVLEPELDLTKAVSGGVGPGGKTAVPGKTLEYTLTVKNTGTWDAYDFKVADKPPANLTGFELGAVEGGTATVVSTNPPVWHVDGPLARDGDEMKFHYKAKLVESGKLKTGDKVKNAAEVPVFFGLPPAQREPGQFIEYPGPKADQELNVELPQVTIDKTSGNPAEAENEEADVGVAFPWKLVVKNTAASAGAKNATVEDKLPAGWSYVPGSATVDGAAVEPMVAGTPQVLTWTVASLPGGAESKILFQAIPAQGTTDGLNGAVVKAEDEAGFKGSEAGPYEAEDTASAHVVAPEFEVKKTPDGETAIAGTEVTYTIEVTNIGDGKASAPITVKDQLGPEQEFAGPGTLEPGVTFVSVNPTSGLGGQAIEWTIASLEKGASVKIFVPVKVPSEVDEGATIKNTAEVESPQAPTPVKDEGHFVIHRIADLAIEKKASPENVVGGENITYTVTVTNHGPSDATNAVVTDNIPGGTEFLKAGPKPGKLGSCNFAAGAVTCNVPVLTNGATTEFEIEVEVESGRLTPITNIAEVNAEEEDPTEPNRAEVTTTIGGLANLKIEKIGPEKPVLLGNQFTYEINVENEGPSDAVKAKVVDPLPPQVKFLSASLEFLTPTAEVGECDEAPAAVLTCELGRMLPHAQAKIVVTVEAAEVGGFDNKATFDSETSPAPKEGKAHAEILPAADLTIEKTAPATVEPDGTLTYTLHVENHGPSIAHKVKVTDPLPAGVDFVSADEGCAAAGATVTAAAGTTTVTCEVLGGGELAVGDTADFKVTVHVPFALGGGSLTNTASVAGEEGDPHPEDDTSTASTTVGPAADLAIRKTMGKAQAGQPLTYTLAVTNKGPSASSAVTVKDTLPAGTTFKSATPSQGTCSASGQTVTCGLGQLASGGSAQVSITVDVAATATGSIRNVASVVGPEPDPDKSNNEASVEGPVTPPVPTDPNLKVVKTADTSSPQVGVPFAYHVEVTNMNGGEAKNVKVIDTLSGPVKVTSIETESGKCGAAGSTITCTIPSIPVGKTVHITYTVVAEAAGELKNTVSAQAANGEKAPGNNRAVKSVKAKAAKGTFELTKTASRKVVPGGKKVAFTISLRNGAAALTDAKICDRLPAALVFVKAAGARYVNGEACWTKKFVAADHTVKLHLTARAVKGYKSRKARNVATAQADNASRRSAAATVRVKPAFAGKPGGVTG
ncbi:MAG: isopeptide-forming domain-containing fimbrial protein [Solirubrobacterales bacterium]